MFIIEKQPENLYTVICRYTNHYTNVSHFLYHHRDLAIDDVARFVLYNTHDGSDESQPKVDEDSADYINTIFKLTNIKRVYVSDTGRVSAVMPM